MERASEENCCFDTLVLLLSLSSYVLTSKLLRLLQCFALLDQLEGKTVDYASDLRWCCRDHPRKQVKDTHTTKGVAADLALRSCLPKKANQ